MGGDACAYLDRMYASGDLVVSDEARELARACSATGSAGWIAAPRDVDQSHRDARDCCRRRSAGSIAWRGRAATAHVQRARPRLAHDASRHCTAAIALWPE